MTTNSASSGAPSTATSAVKTFEIAAIPAALSFVAALEQFDADMGPNPLAWPLNYPGARLKLAGSVALLVPTVATAEGGALQAVMTALFNSWKTSLTAIQTAAASAAGSTST